MIKIAAFFGINVINCWILLGFTQIYGNHFLYGQTPTSSKLVWTAIYDSFDCDKVPCSEHEIKAKIPTQNSVYKVYSQVALSYFYRQFNIDSGFHYGWKALSLAQELSHNQALGAAYHIISVQHRYLSQIDSAIHYIKVARQYYLQDSCWEGAFFALRLQSEYYMIKADYPEAYSCYTQSIKLAEERRNLYEKAVTLVRMAKLSSHQNNLENVSSNINEGIRLLISLDSLNDVLSAYMFIMAHAADKDSAIYQQWERAAYDFFATSGKRCSESKQIEFYFFLAGMLHKRGQYEVARKNFEYAESMLAQASQQNLTNIYVLLDMAISVASTFCEEKKTYHYLEKRLVNALYFNHINHIGISYRKIGEYYGKQKNDKKALAYYDSACSYFGKIRSYEELTAVYFDIAKIYESQENPQKASDYYKVSADYAIKTQNKYRIRKVYRAYHAALYKSKQYEKAYLIAIQLEKIREAILDEEQNALTKIRENQFELQKKETEVLLLQKEKAIQQLKNNEQFRLILVAFMVVVLTTILGSVAFYHYRKLQKTYAVLEKQQKEILAKNEELQIQRDQIGLQKNEIEQKSTELSHQYEILRNAQRIIRRQHKKLKKYNLNLEQIVKLRTEQLTQANNELSEYANRITNYSFLTAHDLRAPIARIMGLSYLFAKDKDNIPQMANIIQTISKEAYDADSVLHNMMTILNMTQLPIILDDLIPVRLTEALTNAMTKAKVTQLSIDNSLQFAVLATPDMLTNILRTLLQHSARFRKTLALPEVKITASYQINTDTVNIIYQDPLMNIHRNSYQNQTEGLELALYLVKIQTEALQGKMEPLVDTNPFQITLTLKAASLATV